MTSVGERLSCPKEVVTRATELLAAACGGPVRLKTAGTLSEPARRNQLYRLQVLSGPAAAPSSIIVKCADSKSYRPDAPRNDAALGLASDWAGAAFIASLPNARLKQHAPFFYGGDVRLGMLVLEDLGDDQTYADMPRGAALVDRSLVPALLGRDPGYAELGLTLMMGTLGRLHADTMQRQAEFVAVYNGIHPAWRYEAGSFEVFLERRIRELPEILARIGVEVGEEAQDEMREAVTRFRFDSPYTAYIHRDPCPDNCRFDVRGYRLFDLEFAGVGHAFIDASYGRAPFPSCWCCGLVPERVVKKMEVAYRQELVKGFPQATKDAVFERGMLDGLLYWALVELGRLEAVIKQDRPWGITSIRPRLRTRLSGFVDAAASFSAWTPMPKTTRCFADAEVQLARLWGEDVALPLYPAFR